MDGPLTKLRDGATAARLFHRQKDGGSNPPPATIINDKRVRDEVVIVNALVFVDGPFKGQMMKKGDGIMDKELTVKKDGRDLVRYRYRFAGINKQGIAEYEVILNGQIPGPWQRNKN